MTRFRPCIDLHQGQVKQIVGGTLDRNLETNFVSKEPPEFYAELYKKHNLKGGHVIKLGPDNDEAAIKALQAWPLHLQVGGGITIENAQEWLDLGASKVIVTSWLFPDAQFDLERLRRLAEQIGRKSLVIDLSCRVKQDQWVVAMNKWQTETDMVLSEETFELLDEYTSEYLIHAADVEGLCSGIDTNLCSKLGKWCKLPCTYAGGAKDISDLDLVKQLTNAKLDLTIGSALDIFGGNIKFDDLVEWNKMQDL